MAKLFIVGVGRSGTSLLQSMFASNSNVHFLPETGFIRRYLIPGKLEKILKKSNHLRVLKTLEEDEKICRLNINIKSTLEYALSNEGQLDFNFLNSVFNNIEKEIKWVGDKDPRLIEHLDILQHLFTNSYIINITRDLRDVLVSRKKSKWAKGHIWKHMIAIRVQHIAGIQFKKTNKSKNFFTVSYEKLIENPSRELKELCSLIDLKYEKDMLNFSKAAKKLVSKSEVDWKKETFGPLLKNNSGKWKMELPEREAALVELSSSDFFSQPGYRSNRCFYRLCFLDQLWVVLSWIIVLIASHIIIRIK